MDIRVFQLKPGLEKSDALVVGVFEDRKFDSGGAGVLQAAERSKIRRLLDAKQFKGKCCEVAVLNHPSLGAQFLVAVGLGKFPHCTNEDLRKAAARVYAKAKAEKWSSVVLDYEGFVPKGGGVYSAQAIAEGFLLSSYRFDKYKSGKKDENDGLHPRRAGFVCKTAASAKAAAGAAAKAKIISEGVFWVRDAANEPPNVLYPESYARRIARLARSARLRIRIFGEKKLAALKMGGIIAVGQGSARKPRLVIVEYKPARAKNKRPIVLVGKGITFDTGGISLKPGKDMEQMKFDMCGSAAVAAAVATAARLKLPLHVVGITPLAENMPGGGAQRPGDVITCYNGKTVDVLNTDAEGRLVLADALAYAKNFKPKCVVDAATLTGLCAHFFDHVASGLMGTDADLLSRLKNAGEKTGERVWELPLWEDYEEMIKGSYGDIQNISRSLAGTITAGMFLKHFGGHAPWAHLDIAGTAWSTSPKPYRPVGATGVGLRLFIEFLESYAA